MPATVKEVLARALVVLDRDGWCQSKTTNENGQHCMIGLIETAYNETDGNTSFCHRAKETVRGVIGSQGIADWNDAPERTVNDVRAALTTAMGRA